MNIHNLVKIKIIKIKRETIVFTKKTRGWCLLPYPNHPKGCPNYNNNPLCPPKANYMSEKIGKYKFYYLIYANFNFRKYREQMTLNHPTWSDRQIGCVLYWQNSVKKRIKDFLKKIYIKNSLTNLYLFGCGSGFNDDFFKQEKILSMEAAGINVFSTLKNNDIEFEAKPKNKILLVTLLCSVNPLNFDLIN